MKIFVLELFEKKEKEYIPDNVKINSYSIGKTYLLLKSFGINTLAKDNFGKKIDVLCLGIKCIERIDFKTIIQNLRKIPNINIISNSEEVNVPFFTLYYDDVFFYFRFCYLPIENYDLDFISNILKGSWSLNFQINEKDLLSLINVRVAEEILKFIIGNKSFFQTLKLVNIWAESKVIHNSSLGYLGEINWVIFLLKIVQMFPKRNTFNVIQKFFYFYSRWRFGIERSIILKEKEILKTKESFQNYKQFLVPITIPYYSFINLTYTVFSDTYKVIKDEFKQGLKILKKKKN